MKEDFLHYLWKFRKFNTGSIYTSSGEAIFIHNPGTINENAGPDFFNSKIQIGHQLWAGNVEIHLKSSDWYLHHHEKDVRYNNVILHVVWQHDVEIFRSDGTVIPTLELQNFANKSVLNTYTGFLEKKISFITCENSISEVDTFLINHWKDNLFIERLEQKTNFILKELEASQNDWEAVLFKMLFKNFGLKVNGDSFYEVSRAFDFSLVRKLRHDPELLESLFFGCAGLLQGQDCYDAYYDILNSHYLYLQKKYHTISEIAVKPSFFRLRPANFPTIRLSQLAQLYAKHSALFTNLMETHAVEDYYEIFKIGTGNYWKTHYTWGKKSTNRSKKITTSFIDLLIINTIIPIKFCYYKTKGFDNNTDILNLISSLPPEKNTIIKRFNELGIESGSALDTQAILQLYNNYCTPKKCLDCAIGNKLLSLSS